MKFFEDITITDTIEINSEPSKIYTFLTNIIDDKSYQEWHKNDHVSFKWVKGEPWHQGSVMCAEEFLHGKLHKFKFEVTKVVPFETIEYRPTSPLIRLFFPKNQFLIQECGDVSKFTASGTFRIGWIGKKIFMKSIDKGLASVKKHMKEEGENLKSLLEDRKITQPLEGPRLSIDKSIQRRIKNANQP